MLESDNILLADVITDLKGGNFEKTIQRLDLAEVADPEDAAIDFLRGICFKTANRWDSAEQSFLRAIEKCLFPTFDVLYEVANAQRVQGKISEAENTIRQAIEFCDITTEDKTILSKVASLFYHLNLMADCISWVNEYGDILLSDVPCLELLGSALERSGNPSEALEVYQTAIKLGAKSAHTFRNTAVILSRVNQRSLALKYLELSEKIDPNYKDIYGKLMSAAASLQFEKRKIFADEIAKTRPLVPNFSDPFPIFFASDDPSLVKSANESFAKYFPNKKPLSQQIRSSGTITIGYMSADFRNHATTYLIEDFIKKHNRQKFRILGFNFSVRDPDTSYHNILEAFDDVFDISDLSDENSARLIADQKVDILIDLKGYTKGCRPGVFCYRPAPIQINWLGYPGTMGNKHIDYIIGDKFVTPAGSSQNFSEKIIQLPCCYQPNNPSRELSAKTKRKDHLLREDSFIFCCFNNHWKWTEEMVNVWKVILDSCPNSQLWLMKPVDDIDFNAFLNNVGFDLSRVVLAPLRHINEHLERLRHADLFLDTFPCGAHTTASDAIRSGLPVLCVEGASFHSRVSSSILKFAGAPELVCGSQEEYLRKAIHYYKNPNELQVLRKELMNWSAPTHPFNIEATVSYFEKAIELAVHKFPEISEIKVDP